MTEIITIGTDGLPHGLGAIQSPPDARDWPVSLLYAAEAKTPVTTFPASYRVPSPFPPIYDQGVDGTCVAFSSGSAKAYQDLRDTGPFTPDFLSFFKSIGGDLVNGADPRTALQQMVTNGYPAAGDPASAARHKIAAYFSIPVTESDIKSAIMSFGEILLAVSWYRSWFHPDSNSILPAPDTFAGGHEIVADGWTAGGLELVNSWGTGWGYHGRCVMPWQYLTTMAWAQAWKSRDVIETPPKRYSLLIAAHATVKSYVLSTSGCLSATRVQTWGDKASSAGCAAPVVRRGCSSGTAMTVHVPSGAFVGREVKLGPGVTVVAE
jgi:hypothetical protein